jgi:cysteinyl-tRNA synthetase
MFVCGPTVYDRTHVGHARTYIVYDVLARYLQTKNYHVRFIINITDIDDKVFKRAKKENTNYRTLADRYTQAFIEDLRALHIDTVDAFIKASYYLSQMEWQIQTLLEKKHAYRIDTGDIYFDTATYPKYGRLAHVTAAEIKLRRLDPHPQKRNQSDFILWRSWNQNNFLPSFPSRFGAGRPGWHIEDTAISISNFGSTYDIHGGAIELVFPHHEAEIAQAEAIIGHSPFVKYWVHTGLLTIDGEKMSKSLGNILTIRDALDRWHPDVLRLYLLSRHYNEDFDFRPDDIAQFEEKAAQIRSSIAHLRRIINFQVLGKRNNQFQTAINNFYRALDNDLDTPKAIDNIIDLLKLTNEREAINPNLLENILRMLNILGLRPE